jgi:hypothetical protein
MDAVSCSEKSIVYNNTGSRLTEEFPRIHHRNGIEKNKYKKEYIAIK